MTIRSLSLLLILLCVIYFGLAVDRYAQSSTPSPGEALIESIKEQAQRDARAEKPPADAQDLNLLFGSEASKEGISLRDVLKLYQDAYSAAKPTKSWWETFLPHFGWITAIILFLLLLFRNALEEVLKPKLKALGESVYNRVAGLRILRRKGLKNYRKALTQKYQAFKVPFRSDRALDMTKVYVPMKVKGMSDIDQIEDLSALKEYRRLMVLGAPGSGKSMLLKRISLSYATGGLRSVSLGMVPVLLELRRLNEVSKPFADHLADIFKLNGFPNSKSFIDVCLEQGTLLLLLDGLDEVNSAKREEVVNVIGDFLDQYERCSALITCRTAVYRNEFADAVDQTLEIIEFNDQQIQKFLSSWPGIPQNKSINELILTLRERPRIMALARNPLLLTIIAFLYTDMEEFLLPHSRTEFYTQAVDVLLQQLKGQLNRYRVSPKLLVLEQLALYNQERGSGEQADRLSLDVGTVIGEINKVLPKLNLDPKDAAPLLQEIVERSGLLLEIDNRTRYQFSHLTLQEYFAASALKRDYQKLLSNFRGDPDAWRETVKLWCGLPHDSTEIINTIYQEDPITAFECLADAQKIEPGDAEFIIDSFKGRLSTTDEKGEAIIKAFAAVASGPSQRSQSVLRFLIDALGNEDETKALAAATALSLTNKPSAVLALAECADVSPQVRDALVRMGDLAVPMLAEKAESGSLSAAHALHSIGTAQAARSLVPLLWHDKLDTACFAALALAELLRQKIVEDALSHCKLTPQQRKEEGYSWVWKPFDESGTSPLSIITSRIARLIDEKPVLSTESKLDRRIVIPLVVNPQTLLNFRSVDYFRFITGNDAAYMDSFVRKIPKQLEGPSSSKDQAHLAEFWERVKGGIIDLYSRYPIHSSSQQDLQSTRKLDSLLSSLAPIQKVDLIRRFVEIRIPTLVDWQNVLQSSTYRFEASWHFRTILFILAAVSAQSLAGIIISIVQSTPSLSWKYSGLILIGLMNLMGLFSLSQSDARDPEFVSFIYGGILTSDLLQDMAKDLPSDILSSLDEAMSSLSALLLTTIHVASLFYFGSSLQLRVFPIWIVGGIWLVVLLTIYILSRVGLKKDREAKNPLHGVLEIPESRSDEDVLAQQTTHASAPLSNATRS